jgi:hypothetical protein
MRSRAPWLPLPALALLALVVSATTCRQVAPLPADALTELASLDQFRAVFNADAHRARLLVLLAPT